MAEDIVMAGISFLLAFMSFYVLFEMIRINKFINSIEIQQLSMIPIMLGCFYLYLSVWNPDIEVARLGSRFCMFASLSIALGTLYSYSRKLRAKGRKK